MLAAPLVRSPNSLIAKACPPGDNPEKLASIFTNCMLTCAKRTIPKMDGPLNSATAADTRKSEMNWANVSNLCGNTKLFD